MAPPWLRFEILSPSEFAVDRGTRIDYRLRIRGLPIRWQNEIIIWEPPTRLVDQQTRGPYRLWIHEHTFSEQEGGTLAGDNVVYAVPGGKLVQKLFVAPDLDRIFHYRHEILENILPLPLLSIAYAGRRVGLGSCHQPNTKSHSFRRCSIFQWCYG